MELVPGIILLAVSLISTIILCIDSKESDLNWVKILVPGFAVFGTLLLCDYKCEKFHRNKPQVIEVYQGKTTLEVTYRDSIAIDSVVVYK